MRLTSENFITLYGTHACAVIELRADAAPIWRHWGPILPEGAEPPTGLSAQRPVPSFSLDDDVPLTILPTFGAGWFGAPALLAHRDGKDFAQCFTRCAINWVTPRHHVIFTLSDDVSGIDVTLSLHLNPADDVLTCQTSLTNTGQGILNIQWLASASLPLPASSKSVRAYAGRHNHEFQLFEDHLSPATWLRDNRRGLTSHDCVPAAVVTSAATTYETGPTFGAQLAWSGNHTQRIDGVGDGTYHWQMGQWLAPGEVRLDPGATHQGAAVLATFSPFGLNGVAQNFHTAIRARMTWPTGKMAPRPVHFNTWEGVYFFLQENALKEMATGAAALGVERFVLDDGWFKGRRFDNAGLGDWFVDDGVFSNGLGPLIDHVRGLGMKFGLWVEPEMVNPDSDLYRAHPDWALQIKGRALLTARNQLVLDLSNPAVVDYLVDRLGALLDAHPISYLKWDHNRDLTHAGHDEKAAYHSQVLNAYRLFDLIRARWPQVEIEACAGGGGRIDAGILERTHRVWISDCIDAVSRIAIQRGFLQFFPPEIMGSHIGTSPAHSTGRSQSMDFRAGVALGGHYGIELDPRHLSSSDQKHVKQWVATYKALRDRLHRGRVWQGAAGDHVVWQAHGDADDFILMVYRVEPTTQRWPPSVCLPFVDKTSTYQVTVATPNQSFAHNDGAFFDALGKDGVTIHGAWVASSGLALPAMKGETALILRFTATGTR